ncbi:MAG: hypothetical protein QF440_01815 [Candidatus Thalassarchaeaceae archaeon]|nr:hypothetical protein [Candidatus Thalassarchaeaceae archaeon]
MSPMQEEGGGELSQATAVGFLLLRNTMQQEPDNRTISTEGLSQATAVNIPLIGSDMMNMEYEEMDEEYQREHASMEDPRIVHALDCGPDELEDHYWLMHDF